MAKKADDQTITEQSAVHMIHAVVDLMGHLWHPTTGKDSGIDGEIELRDPATQEVRNVRIGVQSKGTAGRFIRDTSTSFTFRPEPRDVSYWLSSNQPVLLVVVRPGTNELYWRSVQEWARDPAAKAKGYIRFDKQRDRFEAASGAALFNLRADAADRVEPPSASDIAETTLSNHMPIRFKGDTLWSVAIPGGTPTEVLKPAWDRGLQQPGGLHAKRFWSLQPIDHGFIKAVGGTDMAADALEDVLAGRRPELVNILKEVVVRMLVDRVPELRWHAFKKVAYFRRREEHQPVTYAWHSGKPRTVVGVKSSSDEDGHFMRYRHDAAELVVRALGDGWVLQITPTYLFTSDGHKLSGYHDKWLAGIKRLDRHVAVSSSLRMWEHLLVERLTILRPEGHEHFALDPLMVIRLPRSIVDTAWRELTIEEAEVSEHRRTSVLSLLDEAA